MMIGVRRMPPFVAIALALAAVPAFTVASSSTAAPAGPAVTKSAGNARVLGTFAMVATVTTAVGVNAEYAGQTLRRTWKIVPSQCKASLCRRLTLERQRSSGIVELVRLQRTGRGRYAGTGAFYVSLSCLGRTYRLGSLVPFQITLTVAATVRVKTIWFARRLSATYVNPERSDDTPCPLGPSDDAARYQGRLRSPVPSPPAASFRIRAGARADTFAFRDTARRGVGRAVIRTRRWRFGDPGSGASNTSTRADPVHRFSAPGRYRVRLTVTDTNGLSSTRRHTVTVPVATPPPPPTPTVTRPASSS